MKYKVVIERKYQSQVRVQLSQIGLDILFNFNDLSIQVKGMNEWIGHLKLFTAWYQVIQSNRWAVHKIFSHRYMQNYLLLSARIFLFRPDRMHV